MNLEVFSLSRINLEVGKSYRELNSLVSGEEWTKGFVACDPCNVKLDSLLVIRGEKDALGWDAINIKDKAAITIQRGKVLHV